MSPFVIPLASAETVCSTAISTPVFIRAEGLNEQLADVTFTCQGASAAFANIQMFLSPGLPIGQRRYLPTTPFISTSPERTRLVFIPSSPDGGSWFLSVDSDQESWKLDAVSFVESCREMNVPAALELSRSGEGAHVWTFFSAPLPAILARKLVAGLVTRTMQRRHQISLRSYDRLFPNQDTMPTGGFGNLIALPLQKIPRRVDNSVFVDDHLAPFPDQWGLPCGHPQNGTLRRRETGPKSGAEWKCRRRSDKSRRQCFGGRSLAASAVATVA